MNNTSALNQLWDQSGAALDMFQNAITKCPKELWDEESKFWYITFHTIWWTDFYLTPMPCEGEFKTMPPYNNDELDPAGIYPERTYTKEEMLEYLLYCREKYRNLFADQQKFFASRWKNEWRDYSMLEMELYNMRHIQHHTGQLNMLLGRIDHSLPIWVSRTKGELHPINEFSPAIEQIKTELWFQFGGAIDMFENAVANATPQLWEMKLTHNIDSVMNTYWYKAFHTLMFLDYYLDTNIAEFKTKGPLSLSEEEIDEKLPDRVLSKEELLEYTSACREKARKLISSFNEETVNAQWSDEYRTLGLIEMQLYNMRHVMHHTGQLNMMLGRIDHDLPIWVSRTKVTL